MRAKAAALLLLAAVSLLGEEQPKPGPYITIYHDDAVMLQMRRDRIDETAADTYRIWLRWLWATPQAWKNDTEVATTRVVDLDCKDLRVRELKVMHRNAKGEFFDVEEFEAETAGWTVMKRDSGAGKAMERACEFIPQLRESR